MPHGLRLSTNIGTHLHIKSAKSTNKTPDGVAYLRKLSTNLSRLYLLQANLEGMNSNFVLRKVAPWVILPKEPGLDQVSVRTLIK